MTEGLTEIQKQDRRRIVDISYRHKLSHLGSCLSAVDIISEIYSLKRSDERFVLSSGHAGLALYTVMERFGLGDAEEMFSNQGVHPDRIDDPRVDCSTGSLGQGLPIALGMAMADRERNVWALVSDGECSEGSIWESLMIAQKYKVDNLKVYANVNCFGAYDPIPGDELITKLRCFAPKIRIRETTVNQLPFLNGLEAHYMTMNEAQYKEAMEILK